MIEQLLRRMVDPSAENELLDPSAARMAEAEAAAELLAADPFDLLLHADEVWNACLVAEGRVSNAGTARAHLWSLGKFHEFPPRSNPAWDHLVYAYLLENTRMVQIFERVAAGFRSGESLGIPTAATQRWLEVAGVLMSGSLDPIRSASASTTWARRDPEAVRRNAYQRLFKLELAFGNGDDQPATFEKSAVVNTAFVETLESLLREAWSAARLLGDDTRRKGHEDRLVELAERLRVMQSERRREGMLARVELEASVLLAWLRLALATNTPVVVDLAAEADDPAERLRLIGERVGLHAHSRSGALLALADDLPAVLRLVEAGILAEPEYCWALFANDPPDGARPLPAQTTPVGDATLRTVSNWSEAVGRDIR